MRNDEEGVGGDLLRGAIGWVIGGLADRARARVGEWKIYMRDGRLRWLYACLYAGEDLMGNEIGELELGPDGRRPPWPLYPIWDRLRERTFNRWLSKVDDVSLELEFSREEERDQEEHGAN